MHMLLECELGRNSGVVAIVKEDGKVQEADFYCWQHKDQAQQRVADSDNGGDAGRTKRKSTELFAIRERSSVDTLVQRLGIESRPEQHQNRPKREKAPTSHRKTNTQDFQSSRMQGQARRTEKYGFEQPARTRSGAKRAGFWASMCCVKSGGDEDDYVEIVRHRQRVDGHSEQAYGTIPVHTSPGVGPKRSSAPKPRSASIPASSCRIVSTELPMRPAAHRKSSSNARTNHLLALLPAHLSPSTTSTLLAELVKPISRADEEGYIYIFWLTHQSKDSPTESTARSLLSPETAGRPRHGRRISDVMTDFSFDGSEPETHGKKTIMLKIGRANNVTRRMHEWQRQCGYALNLVRWYPYMASSATLLPQCSPSRDAPVYPDLSRPPSRRESGVVKKVPFVKRVERLIHLELHEQQVKRQCAACGKEHREWFEVEASHKGVKAVDECVKRWVGWAEAEQSKA
ncbi:hypothetical protein B0A50_01984 [Salinomyces thailandicus]|uniref:Bacteriophage T5 Orf172 DNA-binding domain-containing protein n=1 Tax=Salinomyces thailandicus TaxID=706561 RepID=A0A4U0U988_9PEZI|nr:hypothetical protein B0A50_01984 [Salinomyces thailandica]